jgi:hypothetical protein
VALWGTPFKNGEKTVVTHPLKWVENGGHLHLQVKYRDKVIYLIQ